MILEKMIEDRLQRQRKFTIRNERVCDYRFFPHRKYFVFLPFSVLSNIIVSFELRNEILKYKMMLHVCVEEVSVA